MVEKAIAIDPTNAAYRRRLAEMYERTGQHERAREILMALVKAIPGVKESYLNSAWQLLHVGNSTEALRQIDKSFELFGPSALGHLIRAMANIDLGTTQEVEQHLDAYLQSADDKGQAHYATGLCYLALDKAQQAQRAFQAALEAQADNIQALLNLAVVMQWQGKYKQAQHYIKQAEQGGEDANILNFIRANLELSRGNLQAYTQLFGKTKAIIPPREHMDLNISHLSQAERQSIARLRNLSLIMLLNKWDNQAVKLSERILEIDNKDPIATHLRQLIQSKRGA
jgi:tetratricopeptide (TPR) repeat protein